MNVYEQLNQLTIRVSRLERLLSHQGVLLMTLDDLLAKVQAEKTVEDSAIALLNGLSAQLKAAIASNDPAKIQAVADAIDNNTATLSAAITANTPTGTQS